MAITRALFRAFTATRRASTSAAPLASPDQAAASDAGVPATVVNTPELAARALEILYDVNRVSASSQVRPVVV